MKAVSLFSGCGGSDVGLINQNISIEMANDILPYAKDTYLANHPETDYILGDVSQITSFPSADILIGCYPCQGFSQGGKRQSERSINYLYREFERALRLIKPKAFIVENVAGMIRSNNLRLFKNQLVRFRFAGYRVTSGDLNAKDFGLPQDRKRIFIVGVRSDFGVKYKFPKPTHGREGELKKFTTIKDAIGHMEEWPKGEYYDLDFHWYYLSRNRYRGWNEQSPTIVSSGRHIGLHPISPKLKKIEHNKWRFVDDSPARRFSYREAAVLQGFDEHIVFPDSLNMTQRYKVIGNAVPPPLFEAVSRPLIELIS